MLWKEKCPLVRKLKLADDEWVVLAVNPWQRDDATGMVTVECGKQTVELPMRGRHSEIFWVRGPRATRI